MMAFLKIKGEEEKKAHDKAMQKAKMKASARRPMARRR
jgi:hypothetical protein